jgi:hypothetical protein
MLGSTSNLRNVRKTRANSVYKHSKLYAILNKLGDMACAFSRREISGEFRPRSFRLPKGFLGQKKFVMGLQEITLGPPLRASSATGTPIGSSLTCPGPFSLRVAFDSMHAAAGKSIIDNISAEDSSLRS